MNTNAIKSIRIMSIILLSMMFIPLYAVADSDTSAKRTIHVATAGTLPTLISESEKYSIEELTLTGELNGTDFRLLRDMAGCNYLGELTNGKLKELDFSGTKVVKGGDACVSTNSLPGWGGSFFSKIEEDDIIPQYLFAGCNMTSVKMPNTIKSIGNWAFYGNSDLTSIFIPNNVTSIGDWAFQHCSGISSITIPISVTSIAHNSFAECFGLTTINVEEGNTVYDSRNNCNAIMETSTNTLVLGCRNTIIPDNVQSIGSHAFYRINTPSSITLPNTVTTIGEYAFGYCTNLKNIDLPEGLTIIDNYAFEGCSTLESVNLPESIVSLKFAAFRSCSNIASISIPKNLNSISDCVFEKCSKLNSVIIQGSVNSIGRFAFHGCSSLTSFILPRSVKSIGEKAFADCSSLTSVISKIVNPFDIQDVFSPDTYEKAILTVPAGKKVSYQAISEWNKFTQIVEGEKEEEVITKMTIHVAQAGTLPDLISEDIKGSLEELTLTGEINGTDFRLLRELGGCDYLGNYTTGQLKVLNLSDVKVVKGGERYVDTDHLPGWGGNFRYTVEQDDVLPQWVFEACNFQSVLIPNTVVSIEKHVFNHCAKLENVTIPNSVTSIGEHAFSGCGSLANISIPNSVITIGNEALSGCNNLSSIMIPNSVVTIGSKVIMRCDKLSTVVVESGNTKYDSRNECNAIIETTSNTLIAGCKNSTIPNTVTCIGNYAFEGCRNLTSIIIPNSVMSIGEWAFNFCEKLTSITVPNSVTTIGEYAFRCCYALTSITISQSITNIGISAFVDCIGLTAIRVEKGNTKYDSRDNCNAIIETASNTLLLGCPNTIIPNGITTINDYAFMGYQNLQNITVPNSVNRIGKRAFSGCGLTSFIFPHSITNIGDEVFYGCSSIKTITSKIRNPFEISINVFKKYEGGWCDAELIVPYGTKNRYETTEGWNKGFSMITEASQQSYNLKMSTDGHGSIIYDGKTVRGQSQSETVLEGLTIVLTIMPDEGYRLDRIKVNNIDVKTQISDNKYTISDFGGDTSLEVEFEAIPYTLSIKTIGNGTVTYDGTMIREKTSSFTVTYGSSAIVDVNPDTDYRIKSVKLNSVDVTNSVANNQYTINRMTSNTSLEVEFMEDITGLTIDNINYTIVSYDDETVCLSGGNYGNVLSVPASFTEKGKEWKVVGVDANALNNNVDLAAIFWNPEVVFNGSVANPNLLLYVKSKDYAPSDIQNVVVNNTAEKIVLIDAADGNNFYCPKSFTAKRISYEHNYSMQSGYKECRGWETIALPFDVTTITSETGAYVVPRAAWTVGDTQQKPFFLYEWTENGWQAAFGIKANTPYIISMPNNDHYDPFYQLKGNFEFVGTNVQVLSSAQLNTATYNHKQLICNYQSQEASQTIYALNVSNLWDKNSRTEYAEGSTFIRSLRPVRPFEAYMTVEGSSSAAPRAIPINETPTGIFEMEDGRDKTDDAVWYTLDGQKLSGKPTAKGIYINGKRKVIVK